LEQRQQLATTCNGIAVGTPFRLRQLASEAVVPNGSKMGKEKMQSISTNLAHACKTNKRGQQPMTTPQKLHHSLLFAHTKLFIFDCHLSNKQYTVCTLPDTAPHCMALVRDHLVPRWQKQKDGGKVAFV
jgi:hypothetical protein